MSNIEKLILVVYCWSMSSILVGINYRINYWPMWDIVLTVGSVLLLLASIILFFQEKKNPTLAIFNTRSFIRGILIIMIGAFFLLIHTEKLVKTGILDDPQNIDQRD